MAHRRAGIFLFLMLMVLVGVAALFAVVALRRPPGIPRSGVLVFEVPTYLEESDPPSSPYSLDWLRPSRPVLWRIVFGIRQAARDERIEALVMHVGEVDWGWAKVAEVREALLAFRAAGKPVYAMLTGGGDREYLLASVADRIGAEPLSLLQIDGLTASALFLRGTLDKLDVNPNFAQSGTYKSGAEGFTRNEMSQPAREALGALLDDLYRSMIDSVSAERGLPRDSVMSLLDRGPFDSETARASGLIDTVLYQPQMDSLATGGDEDRAIDFDEYLSRVRRGGARSRIALVLAAGTIAEGRSRSAPGEGGILGSETLGKALRQAREHDGVDAIILRVDSPGGSATASDQIWREVDLCRREKPVVASMSDYAASGGYYVAVAADTILAHPSTITGSIGVFGGKLNLLGLYRKLGLNVETLSRGRHAEMLSPYRDFTPEEAERFQDMMDVVYDTFRARVADGRGLEDSQVEEVAQGRVWSGFAAKQRELVDELGGLVQAVDVAKAMAGIPKDELVAVEVFPRDERTFLQRFFSEMLSGEGEERLLGSLPGLRAWLAAAELPLGEILTMLPYRIEVR